MSNKKGKTYNPIAKDLRTPKYKKRIVEDKTKKKKRLTTKEIDNASNY